MKIKVGEKTANGKKLFDGAEIVVPDESAAFVEKIEKALDSACAEIDGMNAKLTIETKKAEDSAKEIETMKKTHIHFDAVDAMIEKKINLKRVCDGLNIVTDGKKIVDMEDAIIKAVMPKVSLEGKPEGYRLGILDSAMEVAEEMVKNNKIIKDGVVVKPEEKKEEKGLWEK